TSSDHEVPGDDGRPTVVVVEDNPDLRAYLRQELGRWYRVVAIGDSTEALLHLQDRAADLVLTDVMMPVMDGIDLARRLRASPVTAATPILVLSARDDVDSKLRGFEVGVDDYVTKP